MKLDGYLNKVAWINLTDGTIEYKEIAEEDARKYIGGRGLGVKYVFDNGPLVDPLSPDNLLTILTGPTTGTQVTMGNRLAVVTKSPLTGTITNSHMGGWAGSRIRWAGFDGFAIKGKADKPVYLFVEDGKVEIHDASDLWGKDVYETIQAMVDRYGEQDLSVMAIGQAGENLVKIASIINEKNRAAGRGGVGAVAGSKNLKAIVIRGSQKNMLKPVQVEEHKEARKKAMKLIMDSPITAPGKGGLSVYGTNVLMNLLNTVSGLPAYNGKLSHFDQADNISGESYRKELLVSEPTCHACPVACKKEVEVKDGKYKTKVESMEYETAWSLGAMCGNDNKEASAYMLNQCNRYGIDTIDAGVAIAFAMEASEKGLIEEEIKWGDADKMIELIDKIARREGIGDLLAEGAGKAAKKIGAPDLAMTVKDQGIPAYDPRAVQGIGVTYATSNRGACHVNGYTVASEILGVPQPIDRLENKEKGTLSRVFQDLAAFGDSMDICKFSSFAEGAEEYAAQLATLIGRNMTAEDVMKTGERIVNLERYYNNLNGFDGKDDTLPKRFLTEGGSKHSEGIVSNLSEMLEEYYQSRGWVNGVVPEEKLRELEII
ncbi:aldehyde ferredoxin oxidoreductase family protein [Tepidibacillus fermentans]|uniref:Aldehyde:ferredoxin oxidoreductase n=1 Tax=Tepidibacillus fermentans TaxID=1281767 RepID=A0A4R3KKW6_9BACI|nr:aldehyde ferredoxin oxidoreductase family protein [Tepidibacillus fermentans]TCS84535.1 aldehyde:ferredoxin oxidoreductase [Tepidibacillus fermentans]